MSDLGICDTDSTRHVGIHRRRGDCTGFKAEAAASEGGTGTPLTLKDKEEAAARVKQYEDRIRCGACKHIHLGRCAFCDCQQIEPVASVEGQRTGETSCREVAAIAYQIVGALDAPVRILDYFSAVAQGEFAENPLPFSPEEVMPNETRMGQGISAVTGDQPSGERAGESSVPDVEGMGAREYAEIWAGFKGPASMFVEGKTLDPLAPWQVAIAVRFAEAFHKQARSLRGAMEHDDSWARRAIEEIASTTAPADWMWCPEESLDKNAAVILKHAPADLRGAGGEREPDWKKLYEEMRDFSKTWQAASESREQAQAEELQSMTELTQSWFQKNRALEAELKAQTEWRKVSEAAESREQAMRERVEEEQKAHEQIGSLLLPLVGTGDGTSVDAALRAKASIEAMRECLGKIVEHMRWMEGHAKLRIDQTREDKTMYAFSQGRADAVESLMTFARKEAKLDELLKP